MGQRHQIYIRLPEIYYNENNRNNREAKTIGFHHQWLYGGTALQLLDNFLSIYDRHVQEPYACLGQNGLHEDAEKFAEHIFSVLPKSGSYERVSNISHTRSVLNPHLGDNNDGITIIDLEEPRKPRYAFASLGYTEGRESLSEGLYNARDYLRSYYPEDEWSNVGGRGGTEILKILERLDNIPLIDGQRLAEIFPEWDQAEDDLGQMAPDVIVAA